MKMAQEREMANERLDRELERVDFWLGKLKITQGPLKGWKGLLIELPWPIFV